MGFKTRIKGLALCGAVILLVVACGGTEPGEPSMEPSGTEPKPARTEPTPSISADGQTAGVTATRALYELSTTIPAGTITSPEPTELVATPDPPAPTPELPAGLTQGVNALVHCAGLTAEFWLEYGPPEIDDELLQCLNDYLEVR